MRYSKSTEYFSFFSQETKCICCLQVIDADLLAQLSSSVDTCEEAPCNFVAGLKKSLQRLQELKKL
jgi:hypothetical protein